MTSSPALEATNSTFYLKGQEVRLLSGAVHYFRVVPEYWRDRLTRLKACGLNAVETYVPWNLHEESPGEFSFDGILDIRTFIKTAQDVGLYVLLRPGPYICSEWDFGGLPSWLLHDPNMKVRSAYKPYLEAVDRYLAKILPQIADLQYSQGGPIIAVQLENEYGSYGDCMEYKLFLKEKFLEYGITELLFTSDNGMGIHRGDVPGALITANFQEKSHGLLMFEFLKKVKQRGKPLMVMEFWSGWFDHWGESCKHEVLPKEGFSKALEWILKQKASVNFYMMHGGTNFGFMNGANEDLGATNDSHAHQPYMPDVTSYDYDAPIAENGDLTPKFHVIKELLQKYAKNFIPDEIPEAPAPVPRKSYGKIDVTEHLRLNDMLGLIKPIKSENVVPMEMLTYNKGHGQNFGFILYRKSQIDGGKELGFTGKVKDRAVVLFEGKEVDTVHWLSKDHKMALPQSTTPDGATLDILVENLGRVNYADFNTELMNDQRKGLREDVTLSGTTVKDWEIFPLDFNTDFLKSLSSITTWESTQGPEKSPSLNRLKLVIEGTPQDTFINVKGWSKGVVFVNNFNLGRYWDVGPQKTLYLPGPLLREGENEILVFELHKAADSLEFVDTPDLGETIVHRQPLDKSTKLKLAMLRGVLKMGPLTGPLLRLFLK